MASFIIIGIQVVWLLIVAAMFAKKAFLTFQETADPGDRALKLVNTMNVSAIAFFILTAWALKTILFEMGFYADALEYVGTSTQMKTSAINVVQIHYTIFLACVGIYIVRAYLVVTEFDRDNFAGSSLLPRKIKSQIWPSIIDIFVRFIIFVAVLYSMSKVWPTEFGGGSGPLKTIYRTCAEGMTNQTWGNMDACLKDEMRYLSTSSATEILKDFSNSVASLYLLYIATFLWTLVMLLYIQWNKLTAETNFKNARNYLIWQLPIPLLGFGCLWLMIACLDYHIGRDPNIPSNIDSVEAIRAVSTWITYLYSIGGVVVGLILLVIAFFQTFRPFKKSVKLNDGE